VLFTYGSSPRSALKYTYFNNELKSFYVRPIRLHTLHTLKTTPNFALFDPCETRAIYLSAVEVCSRQGAILIQVYLIFMLGSYCQYVSLICLILTHTCIYLFNVYCAILCVEEEVTAVRQSSKSY